MKIVNDVLIEVEKNDIPADGHFIIPDTIKAIGSKAFTSCNKLITVTIPPGVTTIGRSAFYGCINLTTITIPQGVTRIEEHTFSWCTKLHSVSLPTGLISIGESAFYGCNEISSFIIPPGVTTIGKFAFNACLNLTTITIPQGVTRIENDTFFECLELHSVSLPTSLISIGERAFYGCNMLIAVTLPQGVTIGTNSFSECSNLSIIVINADTLEAHLLIKNQLPIDLQNKVLSKNEYETLQQIKQDCLLDYYKALGKQPHLGVVGHRFNSIFRQSFFAVLPPELLSGLNSYPDLPYQEALPQLDKLHTKIERDAQGAINKEVYQKQFGVLLAAYFNNRCLPTNPKQAHPASKDVSVEVTKELPSDARTSRP